MTYSNQLDLDLFFFAAQEQIYVIIKSNNFPNYQKGSDIDIFCYNKDVFAQSILDIGNQYVQQGFEIKATHKCSNQTHIDFFLDDELEFRFDLYGSLPHYEKIYLKEHYFFSVIENAVTMDRECDDKNYPIFIPATADELLLRYIEYIEWYEVRPDKIKHLNYIIDSISDVSERIRFLDKLHVYTKLPSPSDSKHTSMNQFYAFRQIASWVKILRTIPVSELPRRIYGKLNRKFHQ